MRKRSVANLQNRMCFRNKFIKKQIRPGFLVFWGVLGGLGFFGGWVLLDFFVLWLYPNLWNPLVETEISILIWPPMHMTVRVILKHCLWKQEKIQAYWIHFFPCPSVFFRAVAYSDVDCRDSLCCFWISFCCKHTRVVCIWSTNTLGMLEWHSLFTVYIKYCSLP